MPTPLATRFTLDSAVTFLNHGSFGACPREVQEAQHAIREEIERQPVAFLARACPGRLDAARAALAAFVGADPEDLVAVPNATAGVNTVLRSVPLEPGDEIVVTNHGYNACANAAAAVAADRGARVVVARVPFPGATPEVVVDAVLGAVGPCTRLAVLDHVTSPTGLVFPVEALARELDARGIDTLVDGAHGPGMVALDLDALGAAYYTGNCHKWMCAPKGAAFLHVRRDRRDGVRPLVVSHGANTRRPGRSRFHDEFDWTGTDDPSAFLAVPAAIRAMDAMAPGGWDEVRRRNRALALAARDVLLEALGVPPPCPESMIGALAAVPLPDGEATAPPVPGDDPLQTSLYERYRIEVPVVPWPAPPRRLVRVSAQVYNDLGQYGGLARALVESLA